MRMTQTMMAVLLTASPAFSQTNQVTADPFPTPITASEGEPASGNR